MINNIQFLRAFAAITVVLFHAIGAAPSYSYEAVTFLFLEGWGANGVDIFFVISGFIITHSQVIRRKSPFEFIRGRIIRIVPIYWFITLFVVLIFYALPSIFRELVVTPGWTIASLFFVSSLIYGTTPVVYIGWTLELEVIFYVIFFFSIFIKSLRISFMLVGLSLLILSLYGGNYIVLEFFFGCIAAYIFHKYKFSHNYGIIFVLFGVFTMCLSLLPHIKYLEIHRVFIWGIPSFFLILGAIYSPQLNKPILSYLGAASYSIYLIQFLSVPASFKMANMIDLKMSGDSLIVFCVVISVLMGCALYSCIEKPISSWLGNARSV